jgi:hypothetical protein
MAKPQDEEKPDSVSYAQFTGLKNTVSRERLGLSDLETAVNVDIDDASQLRRRRGYALKIAGAFHSVYRAKGFTVGVKDRYLSIINPNYTVRTLAEVGDAPLAYTEVANTLYFSSSITSGKVLPDLSVMGWGQRTSEGTWLSPVINPTATLGEVRGKLLGRPPLATALTASNGRIYLANGPTLWATELYLYDYVDKTRNFIQFEAEITALGAVGGGLYVGTETACYFMAGEFGRMRMTQVQGSGVLPGSMLSVAAELVRPQQSMSKEAVMFMTQSGICVGLDDGTSYNMTEKEVILPSATAAAALFRRQDGINQYIGVTDTGGTPASNARIGDYVEAEIRRFQGV